MLECLKLDQFRIHLKYVREMYDMRTISDTLEGGKLISPGIVNSEKGAGGIDTDNSI